MIPLVAKVFPEGKQSDALRLSVHLDNCRIHYSNASEQFLDENSFGTVPHPSHSPDLAPSTFRLFGHIKTSLADRTFNDLGELLETITEFVNEIQPSELQFVFHHWIERVKLALANNGDEYHEYNTSDLRGQVHFGGPRPLLMSHPRPHAALAQVNGSALPKTSLRRRRPSLRHL
jgi:hypothetical protein